MTLLPVSLSAEGRQRITQGPRMAAILVVDDNPDLCDVLVRLLRLSGFAAAGVDDGAAALHAVRATPPALVILDVSMPGMDGFEVLRELRGDPGTAAVPVVMYTALNDPSARGRALALGAQDYLVKGATTFDRLAAVVGRYAGSHS
jgi:CheY-like chemotaxis protein